MIPKVKSCTSRSFQDRMISVPVAEALVDEAIEKAGKESGDVSVDLIPISRENLAVLKMMYEKGEWLVTIDQYRTPHGYRFRLS